MNKTYIKPQFQIVRQDERNKVFFTASGPTPGPTPTGSLGTMTVKLGSW